MPDWTSRLLLLWTVGASRRKVVCNGMGKTLCGTDSQNDDTGHTKPDKHRACADSLKYDILTSAVRPTLHRGGPRHTTGKRRWRRRTGESAGEAQRDRASDFRYDTGGFVARVPSVDA